VPVVFLALGRFVAAPGAFVVNHLGVLRVVVEKGESIFAASLTPSSLDATAGRAKMTLITMHGHRLRKDLTPFAPFVPFVS
jgi:hypothetical protein